MTCHELAERIEKLQPDALTREVARLCLLLCNYVDDVNELADDDQLSQLWREINVRLQSVTDQHAAMTAELEKLSYANPKNFSMDQVMVLMRAIKVQSQVIQLYIGQPAGQAIGDK